MKYFTSKTWPRWLPHSLQLTSVLIRLGSAMIRNKFPPTEIKIYLKNHFSHKGLFDSQTKCFRKDIFSWECKSSTLLCWGWQLTPGCVLSFANVLFVNDIKEGRPARAGVILGLRGELVHTTDHTLVHSPLPVLVVHVAVLSENDA